jgi:hypothetical protein
MPRRRRPGAGGGRHLGDGRVQPGGIHRPLSAGQVALVVGDVTGHSIHAAAIMGQLRTTTGQS